MNVYILTLLCGIGGVVAYAFVAGLVKTIAGSIMDYYATETLNTDDDHEMMGWFWPIAVPVFMVWLIMWPFLMKPIFKLAGKASELPGLFPKAATKISVWRLQRKLKVKTEFPEARVVNHNERRTG